MKNMPLVIEPEQLEQQLGRDGLLVVDLCKPETFSKGHIPAAVHL
ncbi:MAG TPA: sulfurtransferase, partial [Chromatiales bacterium]|nr:sulfurtransferase [Chromatiales bacterium]HEX22215.1 sulfurtransferase [Chromatiales bacterium]